MGIDVNNRLVMVAGGGHFGTNAVKYAKGMQAKVAVCDQEINCKAGKLVDNVSSEGIEGALNIKPGSATLFLGDAVEQLVHLLEIEIPYCIVPSVPWHLAGKFLTKWLEKRRLTVENCPQVFMTIMKSIPKDLIVKTDKPTGVIITSYMPDGYSCKVPCEQPSDFCQSTGRTKMGPMHQILAKATKPNTTGSKVLVSRLIGEGVGCFLGSELYSFLLNLEALKPPFTLAIGTACECHGIINVFSVHPS